MTDLMKYVGSELHLFSKAYNWKKYYGKFIKPHLEGKVLEVGAGIGGTTISLCDGTQELWTCLEPDFGMVSYLENIIFNKEIPPCCNVIKGTIGALTKNDKYNSIIYIDVIEHIFKDSLEATLATQHLYRGGKLIILVPAHQYLFSNFDKAVGHYRRYNKRMLRKIIPSSLKEKELIYLDSIGLFASVTNKLFLKQTSPSETQIKFWDEILIKLSVHLDPIFAFSIGKSLLGIWEKK